MALYEIDGVDTADMDRGELLNVAMGLLGQRDSLAEALRDLIETCHATQEGYEERKKARAALMQLEEE